MSDDELAELVQAGIDELAQRGTAPSFKILIDLSASLGVRIGDAARRVAENNSWSHVATISGTTKQAAWSRWR